MTDPRYNMNYETAVKIRDEFMPQINIARRILYALGFKEEEVKGMDEQGLISCGNQAYAKALGVLRKRQTTSREERLKSELEAAIDPYGDLGYTPKRLRR